MKRLFAVVSAVVLISAALLYAATWNGFTLTASRPGPYSGEVTLSYPALLAGEGATLDAIIAFDRWPTYYETKSVSGPCAAGTLTIFKGTMQQDLCTQVIGRATCTRGGQTQDLEEWAP